MVLPVATPELAGQWQEAFDIGDPQVPLLEHDVTPWHSWFSAVGKIGGGQQLALFNDAGLLLRAAEQGFGIALVKAILAKDAIAAGRLVPLAAELHLNDSDVYLVWPQAAGLTPEVAALLNWLQQQLN
jgi:LysR family glycine cleavage system transcriptional activator